MTAASMPCLLATQLGVHVGVSSHEPPTRLLSLPGTTFTELSAAKHSFWSKWLADVEHLTVSRPRDAARAVRRRSHRNSAHLGRNLCPDPLASQEQQ